MRAGENDTHETLGFAGVSHTDSQYINHNRPSRKGTDSIFMVTGVFERYCQSLDGRSTQQGDGVWRRHDLLKYQ